MFGGNIDARIHIFNLCVSSDRKYSRQVEEVDHDG